MYGLCWGGFSACIFPVFTDYNHFEVEFLDEVDETTPPPAIALCTASPMDPPPKSNFKQDFLRFWATGEGICHSEPFVIKLVCQLQNYLEHATI